MVPGYTIKGWLWNFVTSSLLESSFLTLGLDVAAFVFIVRLIEPVLGTPELVKLMAYAATASGVCCFVVQYIAFFAIRRGSVLFTERSSFSGILGALVMALSCSPAAAPDHVPRKSMPALYLVLCCAASFAMGALHILPFAVPGTLAGWHFVRYRLPARLKGATPAV